VSDAVVEQLGFDLRKFGNYFRNGDFGIVSDNYEAFRADPRLIEAIETVGLDNANGSHAEIKIVEIPDDVEWYIHEYDGMECVNEAHKSWS
jgi:hypothetical protein